MNQRATSFGNAGDAYERSRPTYPDAALAWLAGSVDALDVVDVGAGTGKLTRGLTALGHKVTAVDPDPAMLEVLARQLPDSPTVTGSAEHLPLADASADLITFGQAWHWVDVDWASRECARVLRPGGTLGLIWNVRDESVPWVAALTALMSPSAAERMIHSGVVRVGPPFGPLRTRSWDWVRPMTRAQLLDMVASRSAIITAHPAARERTMRGIGELLDTHPDLAAQDQILMPYTTHAFRAQPIDSLQASRPAPGSSDRSSASPHRRTGKEPGNNGDKV